MLDITDDFFTRYTCLKITWLYFSKTNICIHLTVKLELRKKISAIQKRQNAKAQNAKVQNATTHYSSVLFLCQLLFQVESWAKVLLKSVESSFMVLWEANVEQLQCTIVLIVRGTTLQLSGGVRLYFSTDAHFRACLWAKPANSKTVPNLSVVLWRL